MIRSVPSCATGRSISFRMEEELAEIMQRQAEMCVLTPLVEKDVDVVNETSFAHLVLDAHTRVVV